MHRLRNKTDTVFVLFDDFFAVGLLPLFFEDGSSAQQEVKIEYPYLLDEYILVELVLSILSDWNSEI